MGNAGDFICSPFLLILSFSTRFGTLLLFSEAKYGLFLLMTSLKAVLMGAMQEEEEKSTLNLSGSLKRGRDEGSSES